MCLSGAARRAATELLGALRAVIANTSASVATTFAYDTSTASSRQGRPQTMSLAGPKHQRAVLVEPLQQHVCRRSRLEVTARYTSQPSR